MTVLLDFDLHMRILLPGGLGAIQMHVLSLSLWTIFKDLSFVTCNYVFKEIRIIYNVLL